MYQPIQCEHEISISFRCSDCEKVLFEKKTCQTCNYRNRRKGCEKRCTLHNKLVEPGDGCGDWKV